MFAVKHSPFDMIPQVIKRGEDDAKRPASVMRKEPRHVFKKRYRGLFSLTTLASSKKRVPLASSNPFLLPAVENAWQGNPPHRRSKSGSSLGSMVLASG